MTRAALTGKSYICLPANVRDYVFVAVHGKTYITAEDLTMKPRVPGGLSERSLLSLMAGC